MNLRYITFCLLMMGLTTISAQDKPVVVTSVSILQDMAEMIAGDEFVVQSIVPIGSDPHLHEPTPKDAKKVVNADLVIVNGLTLEGWLNELIENAGSDAEIVTVTDGLQAIASQTYKDSSDPHAWMDASNGIKYIENIKNSFIKLKPESREIFEFNFGVYKQQLQDLDDYIFKAMASIPEQQRILITSHDAFQYYGRRYGIQLEALLGTSTDAQAQTSDMTRVNNVIRASKVPALFVESTINPKMIKQIAADNDIVIGGHLYADSIGEEGSGADSYYDMLKHNTDEIVRGLTRPAEQQEEVKIKSPSWMLWAGLALLLIAGFFILSRSINKS